MIGDRFPRQFTSAIKRKEQRIFCRSFTVYITFLFVKHFFKMQVIQENEIETRPMVCGSMGTQPFYVKKYGRLELPNVTEVDKNGFYVPNHPKLTKEQIEFVCEVINKEI